MKVLQKFFPNFVLTNVQFQPYHARLKFPNYVHQHTV